MAVERRVDRIDAMLVFLVVIWGSAFPGIKVLGEVLDPYQMTWFRYVPFPVLYGLWLLGWRRGHFARVAGGDWIRMGLLGTVGVIGYHFPLNWGLHGEHGISAATGAILVATTPLWTLILAVFGRHERWSRGAALGSLVAFAGVALVVLYGRGDAELDVARRALVVLFAPVSWAVYSVYSKPLIAKYGGMFVTGVTLSLGVLVLVPLGISYGTAPLAPMETKHWLWLLFLAFLSTMLGYALWNHALKHRAASSVAAYVYFNPVVAAAVGWLFLDERLTGWFLAGASLVILGVVLVNRARVAPARPAAAPPAEREA